LVIDLVFVSIHVMEERHKLSSWKTESLRRSRPAAAARDSAANAAFLFYRLSHVMEERHKLSSWRTRCLRQSRPTAAARDSAANASQKQPHACYKSQPSSPYKQKPKIPRMINNLEVPITPRRVLFAKQLAAERGQPPQDGSDANAEFSNLSDYVFPFQYGLQIRAIL